MLFPNITALFISALGISQALATPLPMPVAEAPRQEPELIKLEEWEVEGGLTMSFWGIDEAADTTTPETNPLQRRCGSNNVQCYNDNLASGAVCGYLLAGVGWGLNDPIDSNRRSLCMIGAEGKCCVSWANNVSGLKLAYLVNAGKKTLSQCEKVNSRAVSGKARDANLNGVCTTQCLSDRPEGCSNN